MTTYTWQQSESSPVTILHRNYLQTGYAAHVWWSAWRKGSPTLDGEEKTHEEARAACEVAARKLWGDA